MTKKVLLIIGILAIIGAAAFLVYSSRQQPASPDESRVGFSIRDYFPFGRGADEKPAEGEVIVREEPGEEITNIETGRPVPRLRKLSSEPSAGAVIWNVGTTSIVRFVEKGTGNVYEAKSDSVAVTRLTNTTIPKIIRAYWLPDGSGFLAQTLQPQNEVVETSLVKLKKNAATTTESLTPFSTTISRLPTGIKEITIRPDGSKIFYYTAGAVSNWYVSNPDGTGAVSVFSHPLTEWIPKWVAPNLIMLQNKSSSESISYTYSFDLSGKSLIKTGVGALGMSFNPNADGAWLLVSSGGTAPKLNLVDAKKGTFTGISANTVADKCVWTKEKSPVAYCAVPDEVPSGNYPDIWYKGLIHTSDSIMKIDLANDIFYNTANVSELADTNIDVADISISPRGNYLIFSNKTDGFLWMLKTDE